MSAPATPDPAPVPGPVAVDATRFLGDLDTLRSFGASGTGVVRPSFSETDMAARRWLAERMTAAGLRAEIDGVGNVWGRSPNPGPALLIGSHSDTQPTGGWLDGAYGVIAALEVARALLDDPASASLPVDVVAWVDEESTYAGCLGSRWFCALISDEEVAAAAADDGTTLRQAWDRAGLDGVGHRFEPGRHAGYLEAHIEQGANLERGQLRLGVVTAIVGSRNHTITCTGQQNHAGTTPMELRRDAGRALIDLAASVDEVFTPLAGPRTVWTIGRIEFHPGAASIIPGRADLHLQYRDPDPERLVAMEAAVHDLAGRVAEQRSVEVEVEAAGTPVQPAAMDPGLRQHLVGASAAVAPDRWVEMPSAAIHDAMFLAKVMPSAMLFVPSIGGISHDFAEDTDRDDLVLGCQALATAARSILS